MYIIFIDVSAVCFAYFPNHKLAENVISFFCYRIQCPLFLPNMLLIPKLMNCRVLLRVPSSLMHHHRGKAEALLKKITLYACTLYTQRQVGIFIPIISCQSIFSNLFNSSKLMKGQVLQTDTLGAKSYISANMCKDIQ